MYKNSGNADAVEEEDIVVKKELELASDALNQALEHVDAELDKQDEEKIENVVMLPKYGKGFFKKISTDKQASEENEHSEKSSVLSEEMLANLFDENFDEGESEEGGEWYSEILSEVFRGQLSEFKMARKLYQNVQRGDARVAYFYKLSDKRALEIKYVQIFDIIKTKVMEIFTTCKNMEGIDTQIKKIAENQQSPIIYEAVIDKILGLGLLSAIEENYPNAENMQHWFSAQIRDEIRVLGAKMFFGVEDYSESQNSGAIYTPGLLHTWAVNLSWVLSHLRKGSEFKIISDIKTNKNRTSLGREKDHSAFLREICVCLKAGYVFYPENMRLKPSSTFLPENCISNGKDGSGINPSNEEIETMFIGLTGALQAYDIGNSSVNKSSTVSLPYYSAIIKERLAKPVIEEESLSNTSTIEEKSRVGNSLKLTKE